MRFVKPMILALCSFCMSISIVHAEPQKKPSTTIADRMVIGAEGIWLTKQGKSHLKIIECEKSLCNEVIWLKQPNDSKGRPHTDKLNKIKKLRGRPILGLAILTNMSLVGKGHWQGRIYDPERGKSFGANVKLIGKNKLQVQGCLPLGPPFCQTHIWTKVRDLKPADYETSKSDDAEKSI